MNIEDLKNGRYAKENGVEMQQENIKNINLKKPVRQNNQDEIQRMRMENAPKDYNPEEAAKFKGADLGNGVHELDPRSIGIFDKKVEEEKSDIQKLYEKFDNEYYPKKLKEIEKFNAAIDTFGSVTEEEMLQMEGREDLLDIVEHPERIKALKTIDISDERVNEIYKEEQENRRIEMENREFETVNNNTVENENANFDFDPDHYNLPTFVDEVENPKMDEEFLNIPEENDTIMDETTNVSENVKESFTIDEGEPDENYFLPESTIVETDDTPYDEFDDEDKDDDSETVTTVDAETGLKMETDEEIRERFKNSIREKIKPVTAAFDISTYTIANKVVSFNNAVQASTNRYRSVKWSLMRSGRPITMRSFKSTELDAMNNGANTDSRYMTVKKQYSILYNHIMDPKPKTVEEWAKVHSFLDLEHIWFAVYRACFEGANYIPRDCTDTKTCRNTFLSDNIPIMDMVKFENDRAKRKFFKILNDESKNENSLYISEMVPISDNYAVTMREPSIYNIVFETALLDEEFLDKHQDLISVLAYIDKIYRIDHVNHQLIPIETPLFQNNVTKTYKGRIKTYSKVIDTLTSDQYRYIITMIDNINKRGNEVQYVYPSMTCPKCNTTIAETIRNPQTMVFLRHQLVNLAI